MTCRHFYVSGRVQGVFFRSSTQREAASLGLRGWVRNRRDGRVEGVACGDEEALEVFVKWLQIGPDSAKVTTIEVTTIEPPEELHGFSVRPTGS